MEELATIAALHWRLLVGVLLPHVDVEVAFASQMGVADFASKFGCGLQMLLHYVHFDTTTLSETLLAFRALVRLLAGVRHAVPF